MIVTDPPDHVQAGEQSFFHHNAIISCWSDHLGELGLFHRKKTQDTYKNIDDHPDIVVYNSSSSSTVELSRHLKSTPMGKTILQHAARESHFAEKKDSQRSNKSTTMSYHTEGNDAVF